MEVTEVQAISNCDQCLKTDPTIMTGSTLVLHILKGNLEPSQHTKSLFTESIGKGRAIGGQHVTQPVAEAHLANSAAL